MKHLVFLIICLGFPAYADQAEIENVTAQKTGDAWGFSVTIRHPDTGWDHYADGWSVIAPDGTELGHRKLLHPHVTEQPFTRSLSGVRIPAGITEVNIRARDNVHGWSDKMYKVVLP